MKAARAEIADQNVKEFGMLKGADKPGIERVGICISENWSEYELHLRDENTDYHTAARRIVERFRSLGSHVVATEVPQGPGFMSWSSRLDRVLAFLLPPE